MVGVFYWGIVAVLLYMQVGYLSMLLPIMVILVAALFYNQMGKIYQQIERMTRLKLLQKRRKRRDAR